MSRDKITRIKRKDGKILKIRKKKTNIKRNGGLSPMEKRTGRRVG